MDDINLKKKSWYIPGIISLIILPLLFFHFTKRYYRTLNINAIQIYWPDYDLIERNPDFFKSYRGHYPPERDYRIIELTGHKETDKTKLNSAQIKIRELLAASDTSKGVHFIFGKESEYWSFIKAVDICRVEMAETYMPYENNLWLYTYRKWRQIRHKK